MMDFFAIISRIFGWIGVVGLGLVLIVLLYNIVDEMIESFLYLDIGSGILLIIILILCLAVILFLIWALSASGFFNYLITGDGV